MDTGQILYDSTYMKVLRAVKFREKQSGPVIPRGWKGTEELVFNDTLMQNEKRSETRGQKRQEVRSYSSKSWGTRVQGRCRPGVEDRQEPH